MKKHIDIQKLILQNFMVKDNCIYSFTVKYRNKIGNKDYYESDVFSDCAKCFPELAKKLVATGDAYLEEGNHWHDNRWGKCTCEKCSTKEGQNQLGKILMGIRTELQNKFKDAPFMSHNLL